MTPSQLNRPHPTRTPLIIVALLVVALLIPGPQPATAAQTVTYTPVADTYVRADRPTTTAGTSSRLRADAAPITNTFLRFDLTSVGANQIQSVQLRLRSAATTTDGGTVAHVASDSWNESTLNWNTAPAADAAPTTSLGSVANSTWASVDVTNQVATDRIVSLRISSSSASAAVYYSRDGTTTLRPQLVVVMSPPSDVTAPSVSITQPNAGSTVRGLVDFAVDASDVGGVREVEFFVDGVSLGIDATAPYSVSWDSRLASGGTHSLGATATDASGNVGAADPVVVNADNQADLEKPTAPTTLTATPLSPTSIDLQWSGASDNIGIDHYIIIRDAQRVATESTNHLTDQLLSPETTYSYTVVAVDATGNESPPSNPATATTPARSRSFTFAAAGDHAESSKTAGSLAALDASQAEFYLALGDMDYNAVDPDSTWCDYVSSRLPTKGSTFPFELVSGNHEEQGSPDGYILNHTACLPDRLGSVVGPGSVYGAEYYFDYPAADPLMRVVMLPPNLTIEGVTYTYEPGSPHRQWLTTVIDQARAAGIPWVTVGSHYQCPSTGQKSTCGMGTQLWNLLLEKRVDLILTGHDHVFARSKQVALNSSTCPSMIPNVYQAGCIVDDGGDGEYPKGAGSVNVVAGTFGQNLYTTNPDDPEAPYFARVDNTTNGFVEYSVSRDRIDARFVPASGTSIDAFSIVSGATAFADVTPPDTPTGLVSPTVEAYRVNLAWAPNPDSSGTAQYVVYRDGLRLGTSTSTTFSDTTVVPGVAYTYKVRAYDSVGNPSAESNSLLVTTPQVPSSSIAFRGSTSGDNGLGATSLTVAVPAAVAPGDVMIVGVAVRGAPTMTAPAGWQLVRMDPSGTTVRQAVYSHVANTSEPTSYVFGFSNTQVAVGAMAAYSGVSTTAPVSASSGQINAKLLQITAPSVDVATDGSAIVGFFGTAALTSVTPPAALTERADQACASTATYKDSIELSDRLWSAIGPTGAQTATSAVSGVNIGQLVVLRPA